MTAFARACIVMLATLPLADTHAQQPARLTGSYLIGGRTLVDAPPDEPKNTHLYLVLEGTAARDTYRAMSAHARRDACLDDGSLTKTIGAMQCTALAKTKGYRCAFSVNVADQKIEGGSTC